MYFTVLQKKQKKTTQKKNPKQHSSAYIYRGSLAISKEHSIKLPKMLSK